VQEKAVGALAGEIGRSDPRFVVAAPMAGTAEDKNGDAAPRGMQREAALLWATCVPACDPGTDGDASRSVRRPR
jgi:hypothetical protein